MFLVIEYQGQGEARLNLSPQAGIYLRSVAVCTGEMASLM